ncbi:toprim domain-containing protein [uncultured Devosia sp.]|uniref:DUF7146 domain-containing protein n=1 Tax=uncultured Devosia sp. TaxID=211434 RepID=UPI0030ED1791|tara:strand:- start:1346 stop:2149 length:804 start_codon:yes stop_codon:yes gene_type:complete
MLDLVQRELSLTKSAAITWLEREWFGQSAEHVFLAPQTVIERERQLAIEAADRYRRLKNASFVWRSSSQLYGSPAEKYLAKRLGGTRPPPAVVQGGALRWNPAFRKRGSIGAMIALLTDPLANRPTGVHATFITPDFCNLKEQKTGAGKQVSVRRTHGNSGIVRLWPDDMVETFLALGEGIESTLAGVLQTSEQPAWATVCSGNMSAFPFLEGIEGLRIYVDNDANGTGQRAADALSLRYWEKCVAVRQYIPSTIGDFNDILLAEVG